MGKPSNSSTSPKPFVFVLMPFASEFDDIYKLAIRPAAAEAGAFAQRVDEQQHDDDILDRILSQISKADFLIADMTGRNPNVFYEVGYGHALGKKVILLAHTSEDIPFDLKHRHHIVYEGSIAKLKEKLLERVLWAVGEVGKTGVEESGGGALTVAANGVLISERESAPAVPTSLEGFPEGNAFEVNLVVKNISSRPTAGSSHVYLCLGKEDVEAFQLTVNGVAISRVGDFDDGDSVGWRTHFRVSQGLEALPPRATTSFCVRLRPHWSPASAPRSVCSLVVFLGNERFEYRFVIET